jgi:hypothetical protein
MVFYLWTNREGTNVKDKTPGKQMAILFVVCVCVCVCVNLGYSRVEESGVCAYKK